MLHVVVSALQRRLPAPDTPLPGEVQSEEGRDQHEDPTQDSHDNSHRFPAPGLRADRFLVGANAGVFSCGERGSGRRTSSSVCPRSSSHNARTARECEGCARRAESMAVSGTNRGNLTYQR